MRRWMTASIAFCAVAVTGVMALMFWRYSDHGGKAIWDWSMLYLWGVVVPLARTRRNVRFLQTRAIPIEGEAHMVVWGPAVVGILMLGAAWDFITRATGAF
jgi:hypothetical protein